MNEVQLEADAGKVPRFTNVGALRRAMRQWARERVGLGLWWHPPLEPPPVSAFTALRSSVEWLRAQAAEWRPRDDARDARDELSKLQRQLADYVAASARNAGTSYYPRYFGELAGELKGHVDRHLSWLDQLVEASSGKRGRHGWDAQTHLVMAVTQEEPNLPSDQLVAFTIAAGLLRTEELLPLFGAGGHPHGPTLSEGIRVKRKQIREVIERHPVLYRTVPSSTTG